MRVKALTLTGSALSSQGKWSKAIEAFAEGRKILESEEVRRARGAKAEGWCEERKHKTLVAIAVLTSYTFFLATRFARSWWTGSQAASYSSSTATAS